jgi:hypothetical protein
MVKNLHLFLAVAVLAAGCDRRQGGQPATAADTAAPLPAATLTIDGAPITFGPARLRAVAGDVTLSAQDAAGTDSFTFAMTLDDPQDLAGQQWHHQAASHERSDSPDGILLDNGLQQLQPLDVTVVFTDAHTATLEGSFLLFADPDAMTAQKTVTVSGTIPFAPN